SLADTGSTNGNGTGITLSGSGNGGGSSTRGGLTLDFYNDIVQNLGTVGTGNLGPGPIFMDGLRDLPTQFTSTANYDAAQAVLAAHTPLAHILSPTLNYNMISQTLLPNVAAGTVAGVSNFTTMRLAGQIEIPSTGAVNPLAVPVAFSVGAD